VEFAVQILQLAHGYSHETLRTTTTLEALEALFTSGLVNKKQYNVLRRAYLFYREIENRSQIYQDRSNPRIPKDVGKVRPLARRLGYQNDEEGAGRFLDEIIQTRKTVRQVFEQIVSGLREILSETGQ